MHWLVGCVCVLQATARPPSKSWHCTSSAHSGQYFHQHIGTSLSHSLSHLSVALPEQILVMCFTDNWPPMQFRGTREKNVNRIDRDRLARNCRRHAATRETDPVHRFTLYFQFSLTFKTKYLFFRLLYTKFFYLNSTTKYKKRRFVFCYKVKYVVLPILLVTTVGHEG